MSTKVIISHAVSDFATWKPGFEAHAPVREAAGFKLVFLGQSVDDPNTITICMDVPSADAARAFLANPDLQKAMQESGVTGPPTIQILSVD